MLWLRCGYDNALQSLRLRIGLVLFEYFNNRFGFWLAVRVGDWVSEFWYLIMILLDLSSTWVMGGATDRIEQSHAIALVYAVAQLKVNYVMLL